MYEKRLIGTWQSDSRKTMAAIRKLRDMTEEKCRMARKIFGKLRLRYTRTKVYTDYKGLKDIAPYKVVAKDANSVAILAQDFEGKPKIFHIHFEEDRYWISVGNGGWREYFRRVNK